MKLSIASRYDGPTVPAPETATKTATYMRFSNIYAAIQHGSVAEASKLALDLLELQETHYSK